MIEINGINADNVLWLNRNSVPKVASSLKRALNGAPLIQQVAITTGHSLVFGTKTGWLVASTFKSLQLHSETTLTPFTLVHNGESMSVIWDHTSGAAVSGEDLFDHVSGDDHVTNVTLKFITV